MNIEMIGTEKQIAWANDIKNKLIEKVNAMTEDRTESITYLYAYRNFGKKLEDVCNPVEYRKCVVEAIKQEKCAERIIEIRNFEDDELFEHFKEDICIKKGVKVPGYSKMTDRQKKIRDTFFFTVSKSKVLDRDLKEIEKNAGKEIDFTFERYNKKVVYSLNNKKCYFYAE